MRPPHYALLALVLLAFIGLAGAVSFPVHDTESWNAGVHTNTEVVSGNLELSGANMSGAYVSEQFDAGDTYEWNTLNVSSSLNSGTANVTVSTSNNSFSTVQNRTTFKLAGGTEMFNISSLHASRYIRFNYSLSRGSGSPTIHYTNITLGDGEHFIIRDTACQTDESELFSLSNITNAHAAHPGYYSDYRVCASGIKAHDYDSVCTGVETPTISFFEANKSYVHLSTDEELFDYKMCTGELSIGIREECPPTTKAIVSIYELPESHIAKPGFYQHQLCGAIFKDVTLMMQFHLGSNDTVYFNTTKDPEQGHYTNDDGWGSSFISAENQSLISGIVTGENTETIGIGYLEIRQNHRFNMTQRRGRQVSFFVPFTEGDYLSLENRRQLIARGNFLAQLNPNFGLKFLQETTVRLTLQLTNVDLVTDRVLASGVHRLVIQNRGTNADGDPKVSINVTG